MKKKYTWAALSLIPLFALTGCENIKTENLVGLGVQSAQVITLSNDDVKTLSDQSCQQMDKEAKIAPANNPYAQRLDKIAKSLGDNIDGTKINYKVYLTPDINAWAMANGCVRVYSGIMDKMTDNELQGVLGHELGHVALGHSKKAMQVAYSTQLARGAVALSGNQTIAALSQSELADFTEVLINSQFSQRQESEADNFSFDYLVAKGINPLGIATAFEKLGGGESSLLSTHPSSEARAKNIHDKIANMNKK